MVRKSGSVRNRPLGAVIQFIRQIAAVSGSHEAPDWQLLRRFADENDPSAFGALLGRHGPLVLAVCRRMLRHEQDIEDAFQATFLVLARKAGSLHRPDLLSNWLYGVAYRTALRAQAQTVRRREQGLGELDVLTLDPPPIVERTDLRGVLDEEVSRLPAKYRATFVLCYLDGRTNVEAAGVLGCPVGTIQSRLAWARDRLRSRLARRGISLPVAIGLATLPPALVHSTAHAATVFTGHSFAAGRIISIRVLDLVNGVLRTMKLARFVPLAWALVPTVATVGIAVGLWEARGPASESLGELNGQEQVVLVAPAEEKAGRGGEEPAQGSSLADASVRLTLIGRALHQYQDIHKHLPPAAISGKDGKPLLSWRVAILPFLPGGKSLYGHFRHDEAWDSPHNRELLSNMPSVYAIGAPSRKKEAATVYQAVVGKGAGFEGRAGLRLPRDFPDGTSDTLFVAEAATPVPWTKPLDLDYDPGKPLPKFGGHFRGGFLTLFADGSVYFIRQNAEERLLRAVISRNGGEVFDRDDLRDDRQRPERSK